MASWDWTVELQRPMVCDDLDVHRTILHGSEGKRNLTCRVLEQGIKQGFPVSINSFPVLVDSFSWKKKSN